MQSYEGQYVMSFGRDASLDSRVMLEWDNHRKLYVVRWSYKTENYAQWSSSETRTTAQVKKLVAERTWVRAYPAALCVPVGA